MTGQLSKRRMKEYSRITGHNKNKKDVEAVTVDYASIYFVCAVISFMLWIYVFFKGTYWHIMFAILTLVFIQLHRRINLKNR